MNETKMHALDALDRHMTKANERYIDQIRRLCDLIARGESITEAMRVLVEIENEIVEFDDQWILLTPDP